jgi:PAS domain-containing protein
VTNAEGVYVDANEAAATLFGVPAAAIVGSAAGTFTKPEAHIDDVDTLWSALASKGHLHSVSVLTGRGATDVRVEFVTIRDGDGPGRHVTFLRAIS